MNDDELKAKILNSSENYNIDEFLSYRKLSISKKLDFLEEASEFFERFTPVENKKVRKLYKIQNYKIRLHCYKILYTEKK